MLKWTNNWMGSIQQSQWSEKARRVVFALSLAGLLTSCGGGSINLAEGGISGTGISLGPITGFGSVYVGGVKYNTDSTEFYRNGVLIPEGQSAFKIGEVISLAGGVNEAGEQVATRIDFESDALGTVTKAAEGVDASALEVLGYDVEIDDLTLTYGFNDINQIPEGAQVEISGSIGANNKMSASAIVLKEDASEQSEDALVSQLFSGVISDLDTAQRTFTIRNLKIDYSEALLDGLVDSELVNGLAVKVSSDQTVESKLVKAAKISQQQAKQYVAGEPLNLQGLVSAVQVDDLGKVTGFVINGLTMQVTEKTQFSKGALEDIASNSFLKVDGKINAENSLILESVTVQRQPNVEYAKLVAKISSVNQAGTSLKVLGNSVAINSNVTLLEWVNNNPVTLTGDQLSTGDVLNIVGAYNNGEIEALRIDRQSVAASASVGAPSSTLGEYSDGLNHVELKGVINAKDQGASIIQVLGVTVLVTENTTIKGLPVQDVQASDAGQDAVATESAVQEIVQNIIQEPEDSTADENSQSDESTDADKQNNGNGVSQNNASTNSSDIATSDSDSSTEQNTADGEEQVATTQEGTQETSTENESQASSNTSTQIEDKAEALDALFKALKLEQSVVVIEGVESAVGWVEANKITLK